MGQIVVENLGKAYKVYPSKLERLKEWLIPFSQSRHQNHWVLQDLNFEVKPGEAVGIIGINGAGKSTLLKMITGTTQPTTGSVNISGRVAALLELGMGFHPDFTGRQNVFMAGQLLGYKKSEIEALMPEIESFAEIGEYIDQPVRVYSSGMQMRLAFSVATAQRPDVLIVDEALAVGDIFFQQKCYQRINQYIDKGTTLLFVSHSAELIFSLCDRAILLDNGKVIQDGDPKTVIDYFQSQQLLEKKQSKDIQKGKTLSKPALDGSFEDGVEISNIKMLVDGNETSTLVSRQRASLDFAIVFKQDIRQPHIGFQIRNARGEPVFMTNTHSMQTKVSSVTNKTRMHISFIFDCMMAPGEYTFTIGVADNAVSDKGFEKQLARLQNVSAFTVIPLVGNYQWAGQCDLNVAVKVN